MREPALHHWQHRVPPMIGPVGTWSRFSAAPCDLGEYLEHSDGTLEALPAGHGLPDVVAYARPRSAPVEPDEQYPTVPLSYDALPLRRVGGPYIAILHASPQPAPQYSQLVQGNQRRTGPPR